MKSNPKTDDAVSRKRLKRKVLERWENEGGKILVDSQNLVDDSPPGEREKKSASYKGSMTRESRDLIK